MVRSSSVPGITAEVIVNNRPCREVSNDDEEVQDREIVRYIEAVPGQHFSIKVAFDSAYPYQKYSVSATVFVDGKRVEGMFLKAGGVWNSSLQCAGVVRAVKDVVHLSRFKFANLITTEEHQFDPKVVKEASTIGEIVVKIQRVKHQGPGNRPANSDWSHFHTSNLPEKALKGRAISAKTALEASQPTQAAWVTVLNIDPNENPLYTFIFKYRTLDDLRAERIIADAVVDDIAGDSHRDDTASQLRKLLKQERSRIRDLEDRLAERSNGSQSSSSRTRVKRERADSAASKTDDEVSFVSARHAKRSRPDVDTEVIDLSND